MREAAVQRFFDDRCRCCFFHNRWWWWRSKEIILHRRRWGCWRVETAKTRADLVMRFCFGFGRCRLIVTKRAICAKRCAGTRVGRRCYCNSGRRGFRIRHWRGNDLGCGRHCRNGCILKPAMPTIGATNLSTARADGGVGYNITGATGRADEQHHRHKHQRRQTCKWGAPKCCAKPRILSHQQRQICFAHIGDCAICAADAKRCGI